MKLAEQTKQTPFRATVLEQIQELLNGLRIPAVFYDQNGKCLTAKTIESCNQNGRCHRSQSSICDKIWRGRDLALAEQILLQHTPCQRMIKLTQGNVLLLASVTDDQSHSKAVIEGLIKALWREKTTNNTISSDMQLMAGSLAQSYEELNLLYKITDHMKFTQQPGDFLSWLCADVRDVIRADQLLILWRTQEDQHHQEHSVTAGPKNCDNKLKQLLWKRAEKAKQHPHGVLLDGGAGSEGLSNAWPDWVGSAVLGPICQGSRLAGVIAGLNHKSTRKFDAFAAKMLASLGNEIAVYLDNSRLYQDMQELLLGSLRALTSSIDAKDPYTCGHSERVARLARFLAQQIGLSQAEQENIYLTGLLHDVGKIGVSEQVLCKPGRLGDDEFEQIKSHPQIGANILGGIRQMAKVVQGVLTHHERFDGNGYPGQLHGCEIPLSGRIVMLADSFDAMTSDRTYQKAMSIAAAQNEIQKCSGTQFDPELAQALLKQSEHELRSKLDNVADDARISSHACLTAMN
ncbi:MAG: HD-GYP domain-containing protein [Sedimentisphaerales bacterium]|nr:HD-GYP domain-containing protein [Sedimentisphaerales bacterium]